MKQIMKRIDHLSVHTLVVINILVVLMVVVPLSVWLVQRRTRTDSRASSLDGLVIELSLVSPTRPPAYIPHAEPQILEVQRPYGKVGDAVIIEGVNFGFGPPPESGVWFGGVTVPVESVQEWTDSRIVVRVPKIEYPQPLKVNVAGQVAVWVGPFTVYDEMTRTSLRLARNGKGGGSVLMHSSLAEATLTIKLSLVGENLDVRTIKARTGWQMSIAERDQGKMEIELKCQELTTGQEVELVGWPENGAEVVLKYASIYDAGAGQFVPFWIEPGDERIR